jgi:hypothetical protein
MDGMLFDFDGDGDDDLVRILTSERGQELVVRRAGPDGLGDASTVVGFDRPVSDVALRRLGPGRPVQAMVTTTCDDSPCVERYVSLSGNLLAEEVYELTVRPLPRRHLGFFPE